MNKKEAEILALESFAKYKDDILIEYQKYCKEEDFDIVSDMVKILSDKMLERANKLKNKETINYNMFRFRIGDTVSYKGYNYKVKAYYFADNFNNYNYYGYVIDYPFHNGLSSSYDEFGNRLIFEEASVLYVGEEKVEKPISIGDANDE
jgi:hypothetical protein